MHTITELLLLLLFVSYYSSLAEESSCGDWETYKDEKCFKIFDEILVNYDEAIKTCAQQNNNGSLATIWTKDEQDFVTNFVFNTKNVADNVWIGVRNMSLKFTRVDNLELSYTNWSPGSPGNDSNYNCVEMDSEKALAGKWINKPCIRKNAVLCEKIQVWSLQHIQKVLIEERYKVHDEVKDLKQNLIPMGFIYAQLPGQNEPKLVWPTFIWEDVSSSYAGLFFRVLGGNSAAFDNEQNENDRYIQSVQSYHTTRYDQKVNVPLNGDWSGPILSGCGCDNGDTWTHQFKSTFGEIRPKNKAIKIWKRMA